MRRIVLDTETTGLSARLGDRILELACIEMIDRRLTGNHFHRYVNPERESEAGALKVHGITSEFLQDKPKFAEIAAEFADFLRGAELVIHNAAFDVGFIDNELSLAGMESLGEICSGVVDTLRLARETHPGRKHSLNALCAHFQIDNSSRTLHGALLDAELLAEVYLAMTRGQESLGIELEAPGPAREAAGEGGGGERLPLLVPAASAEELAAHEDMLGRIEADSKGRCLWRRLETS